MYGAQLYLFIYLPFTILILNMLKLKLICRGICVYIYHRTTIMSDGAPVSPLADGGQPVHQNAASGEIRRINIALAW